MFAAPSEFEGKPHKTSLSNQPREVFAIHIPLDVAKLLTGSPQFFFKQQLMELDCSYPAQQGKLCHVPPSPLTSLLTYDIHIEMVAVDRIKGGIEFLSAAKPRNGWGEARGNFESLRLLKGSWLLTAW